MVARYALALTLALAAPAAHAQDVAPDALLRAVATEVIAEIKQGQEFHSVDQAHMAPEQQGVLTGEFKTLLVRTYSGALANYRGEAIHFKKLRAAPLDTDVTVRSEVIQPGKQSMTLDYHMEKTVAGWKIYDIKVAGVRLVTSYRDVFAEKVRDGGVDGLIKSLEDGNRGGGSRFNSVETAFWEKSRVVYAIFQNMFRSAAQ